MHLLLFQGDSITDAQRNKQDINHLGSVYALMAAGSLLSLYPDLGLRVLNRGLSGNRTRDLLGRWNEDCLDLQPGFLSLFIGINNTWRRYDNNDPTPAEVFEAELNELLTLAFQSGELQPAHTVLLEPFLLDSPAGSKSGWMDDLAPKQDIVRNAAKSFGTRFIPLQNIFTDACQRAPAAHWAPDGVHPTPAGHALIASAWLHTMEDIIVSALAQKA